MREILLKNKKASYQYKILKRYEAGIELRGFEVKALREKTGSLQGAHVTVRGGEAYLLNAHIPAFQPKNTPDTYDPYRNRRLLLNKKELLELSQEEGKPGLTIVPLTLYNTGRVLKVEIAVARGKKQHDKREDIKRRDQKRDVERTLKRKNY